MLSLVVNPDPMTAKLVRFILGEAGHEVVLAKNATSALAELGRREIDAVILEMDLPDRDGVALCQELRRQQYRGPIIFLTKRTQIADKLQAFQQGADDVIIDPFDAAELVARVEAVSHRYQRTDYQALGSILKIGEAELAISELTFRVAGREPILLTPTELRLLECLMRNAGITMSRETLLERTWGYDLVDDSNRVEVYIRRLRKKIERNPDAPEYLQTVRGIGYIFRVLSLTNGHHHSASPNHGRAGTSSSAEASMVAS
jgi:two-component system, OmpR family, response regulator RegX3